VFKGIERAVEGQPLGTGKGSEIKQL
jgi:hypothetical protein